MSDQDEKKKDGGDISSGFGETQVDGPVSDEKAQKMLHSDESGSDGGSDDEDSDDDDDESDAPSDELTDGGATDPDGDVPSPAEKRMVAEGGPVGEPEQLDADEVRAGRGNGGGGGGGW